MELRMITDGIIIGKRSHGMQYPESSVSHSIKESTIA